MLPVPVGIVRRGFAHDDQDAAVFVHGAGDKPLAAIDNVIIPVRDDRTFDIGGIGRGDRWFGHRKSRPYFPVQQRCQPLLFLRLAAVLGQHLHVAGIGRAAIKNLRTPQDSSHDLGQRCVFEIAQTGAVLIVRQEKIPQLLFPGLFLEFIHQRRGDPAILRCLDRLPVTLLDRINVRIHELLETLGELADFV